MPSKNYRLERSSDGVVDDTHSYDGKGTLAVKRFFEASDAANPAHLFLYSIPPGASEGLHTHRPGIEPPGSYDEFYFVVEGSGTMEIAREKVPVTAGDNVFVPNGVEHGIENTSEAMLRIYLIAMQRG